MAEDPGESGELTLSSTLTQTQTRAFGEFGLKFYTGTQHSWSWVCKVYVQTIQLQNVRVKTILVLLLQWCCCCSIISREDNIGADAALPASQCRDVWWWQEHGGGGDGVQPAAAFGPHDTSLWIGFSAVWPVRGSMMWQEEYMIYILKTEWSWHRLVGNVNNFFILSLSCFCCQSWTLQYKYNLVCNKCSSCSCKFKRNVFIMIKVVCYTYLAATTNFFKRNWKKI